MHVGCGAASTREAKGPKQWKAPPSVFIDRSAKIVFENKVRTVQYKSQVDSFDKNWGLYRATKLSSDDGRIMIARKTILIRETSCIPAIDSFPWMISNLN